METFEAKSKKYGGSIIITIPSYFQKKMNIKDGTKLEVSLKKKL